MDEILKELASSKYQESSSNQELQTLIEKQNRDLEELAIQERQIQDVNEENALLAEQDRLLAQEEYEEQKANKVPNPLGFYGEKVEAYDKFNKQQDKARDFAGVDYNTALARAALRRDTSAQLVLDTQESKDSFSIYSGNAPGVYGGNLTSRLGSFFQAKANSQGKNWYEESIMYNMNAAQQLDQAKIRIESAYQSSVKNAKLDLQNRLAKININKKYFDQEWEDAERNYKAQMQGILDFDKDLASSLDDAQDFLMSKNSVYSFSYWDSFYGGMSDLAGDYWEAIKHMFQGEDYVPPLPENISYLSARDAGELFSNDWWDSFDIGKFGHQINSSILPMIAEQIGMTAISGLLYMAAAPTGGASLAAAGALNTARAGVAASRAAKVKEFAKSFSSNLASKGKAALAAGDTLTGAAIALANRNMPELIRNAVAWGIPTAIAGGVRGHSYAVDRYNLNGREGEFDMTLGDFGAGFTSAALDRGAVELGGRLVGTVTSRMGRSTAAARAINGVEEAGRRNVFERLRDASAAVWNSPLVRGAAIGGATEAGTEAIQTMIEIAQVHGFEFGELIDLLGQDTYEAHQIKKQIFDAMAAGGVMGGGLGGAFGQGAYIYGKMQEAKQDKALDKEAGETTASSSYVNGQSEVQDRANLKQASMDVSAKVDEVFGAESEAGTQYKNTYQKILDSRKTLQKKLKGEVKSRQEKGETISEEDQKNYGQQLNDYDSAVNLATEVSKNLLAKGKEKEAQEILDNILNAMDKNVEMDVKNDDGSITKEKENVSKKLSKVIADAMEKNPELAENSVENISNDDAKNKVFDEDIKEEENVVEDIYDKEESPSKEEKTEENKDSIEGENISVENAEEIVQDNKEVKQENEQENINTEIDPNKKVKGSKQLKDRVRKKGQVVDDEINKIKSVKLNQTKEKHNFIKENMVKGLKELFGKGKNEEASRIFLNALKSRKMDLSDFIPDPSKLDISQLNEKSITDMYANLFGVDISKHNLARDIITRILQKQVSKTKQYFSPNVEITAIEQDIDTIKASMSKISEAIKRLSQETDPEKIETLQASLESAKEQYNNALDSMYKKYVEQVEKLNKLDENSDEYNQLGIQLTGLAQVIERMTKGMNALLESSEKYKKFKVESESNKGNTSLLAWIKKLLGEFKSLMSIFTDMLSVNTDFGDVVESKHREKILDGFYDIFNTENKELVKRYKKIENLNKQVKKKLSNVSRVFENILVNYNSATGINITGEAYANINKYNGFFEAIGMGSDEAIIKHIAFMIAASVLDSKTDTLDGKNKLNNFLPGRSLLNLQKLVFGKIGFRLNNSKTTYTLSQLFNMNPKLYKGKDAKALTEMFVKMLSNHYKDSPDDLTSLVELAKASMIASYKTMYNRGQTKDVQISNFKLTDNPSIGDDIIMNLGDILGSELSAIDPSMMNPLVSLGLNLLTSSEALMGISGTPAQIQNANNIINKVEKSYKESELKIDFNHEDAQERANMLEWAKNSDPKSRLSPAELGIVQVDSKGNPKIKVDEKTKKKYYYLNVKGVSSLIGELELNAWLKQFVTQEFDPLNPEKNKFKALRKLSGMLKNINEDGREDNTRTYFAAPLTNSNDYTKLLLEEEFRKPDTKSEIYAPTKEALKETKDPLVDLLNRYKYKLNWDTLDSEFETMFGTSNIDEIKSNFFEKVDMSEEDIAAYAASLQSNMSQVNYADIENNPLFYIPIYKSTENENGESIAKVEYFVKLKTDNLSKNDRDKLLQNLGVPTEEEARNMGFEELGFESDVNQSLIGQMRQLSKDLGKFLTTTLYNEELDGMTNRDQVFHLNFVHQQQQRIHSTGIISSSNKFFRGILQLDSVYDRKTGLHKKVDNIEYTLEDLQTQPIMRDTVEALIGSLVNEADKKLTWNDELKQMEYVVPLPDNIKWDKTKSRIDQLFENESIRDAVRKIAEDVLTKNYAINDEGVFHKINARAMLRMLDAIDNGDTNYRFNPKETKWEVDGKATGLFEAMLHLNVIPTEVYEKLGPNKGLTLGLGNIQYRFANESDSGVDLDSMDPKEKSDYVMNALKNDYPYGNIMSKLSDVIAKDEDGKPKKIGNGLYDGLSGMFDIRNYGNDHKRMFKELRALAKKFAIPVNYGSSILEIIKSDSPTGVKAYLRSMQSKELNQLIRDYKSETGSNDIPGTNFINFVENQLNDKYPLKDEILTFLKSFKDVDNLTNALSNKNRTIGKLLDSYLKSADTVTVFEFLGNNVDLGIIIDYKNPNGRDLTNKDILGVKKQVDAIVNEYMTWTKNKEATTSSGKVNTKYLKTQFDNKIKELQKSNTAVKTKVAKARRKELTPLEWSIINSNNIKMKMYKLVQARMNNINTKKRSIESGFIFSAMSDYMTMAETRSMMNSVRLNDIIYPAMQASTNMRLLSIVTDKLVQWGKLKSSQSISSFDSIDRIYRELDSEQQLELWNSIELNLKKQVDSVVKSTTLLDEANRSTKVSQSKANASSSDMLEHSKTIANQITYIFENRFLSNPEVIAGPRQQVPFSKFMKIASDTYSEVLSTSFPLIEHNMEASVVERILRNHNVDITVYDGIIADIKTLLDVTKEWNHGFATIQKNLELSSGLNTILATRKAMLKHLDKVKESILKSDNAQYINLEALEKEANNAIKEKFDLLTSNADLLKVVGKTNFVDSIDPNNTLMGTNDIKLKPFDRIESKQLIDLLIQKKDKKTGKILDYNPIFNIDTEVSTNYLSKAIENPSSFSNPILQSIPISYLILKSEGSLGKNIFHPSAMSNINSGLFTSKFINPRIQVIGNLSDYNEILRDVDLNSEDIVLQNVFKLYPNNFIEQDNGKARVAMNVGKLLLDEYRTLYNENPDKAYNTLNARLNRGNIILTDKDYKEIVSYHPESSNFNNTSDEVATKFAKDFVSIARGETKIVEEFTLNLDELNQEQQDFLDMIATDESAKKYREQLMKEYSNDPDVKFMLEIFAPENNWSNVVPLKDKLHITSIEHQMERLLQGTNYDINFFKKVITDMTSSLDKAMTGERASLLNKTKHLKESVDAIDKFAKNYIDAINKYLKSEAEPELKEQLKKDIVKLLEFKKNLSNTLSKVDNLYSNINLRNKLAATKDKNSVKTSLRTGNTLIHMLEDIANNNPSIAQQTRWLINDIKAKKEFTKQELLGMFTNRFEAKEDKDILWNNGFSSFYNSILDSYFTSPTKKLHVLDSNLISQIINNDPNTDETQMLELDDDSDVESILVDAEEIYNLESEFDRQEIEAIKAKELSGNTPSNISTTSLLNSLKAILSDFSSSSSYQEVYIGTPGITETIETDLDYKTFLNIQSTVDEVEGLMEDTDETGQMVTEAQLRGKLIDATSKLYNLVENSNITDENILENVGMVFNSVIDRNDDTNIDEDVIKDGLNQLGSNKKMNTQSDGITWGEVDSSPLLDKEEYLKDVRREIHQSNLPVDLKNLQLQLLNDLVRNLPDNLEIRQTNSIDFNGMFVSENGRNVLLLGRNIENNTKFHELVHAATKHAVESDYSNAKSFVDRINQYKDYVKQAIDKNDNVAKQLGLMDEDGNMSVIYDEIFNTNNIHEFMAYFLTDSEKLKYIQSISKTDIANSEKVPAQSLLGKAFNGVKWLFKLATRIMSLGLYDGKKTYIGTGGNFVRLVASLSDYNTEDRAKRANRSIYNWMMNASNDTVRRTVNFIFRNRFLTKREYMRINNLDEKAYMAKRKEAVRQISELLSNKSLPRTILAHIWGNLKWDPLIRDVYREAVYDQLLSSKFSIAKGIAKMMLDFRFIGFDKLSLQQRVEKAINLNQAIQAKINNSSTQEGMNAKKLFENALGDDKLKAMRERDLDWKKPSDDELRDDIYNRKRYNEEDTLERDIGNIFMDLNLSSGLGDRFNRTKTNDVEDTILNLFFGNEQESAKFIHDNLSDSKRSFFNLIGNKLGYKTIKDMKDKDLQEFYTFVNNAARTLAMARLIGTVDASGMNNTSNILRSYKLMRKDNRINKAIDEVLDEIKKYPKGHPEANKRRTAYTEFMNGLDRLITSHTIHLLKDPEFKDLDEVKYHNLMLDNIKEKFDMKDSVDENTFAYFTYLLTRQKSLKDAEVRLNIQRHNPEVEATTQDLLTQIQKEEDPAEKDRLLEILEQHLEANNFNIDGLMTNDYRLDYSLDNRINYGYNNNVDIKTIPVEGSKEFYQDVMNNVYIDTAEKALDYYRQLGYELVDVYGMSHPITEESIKQMKDEGYNSYLVKYSGKWNNYTDNSQLSLYIKDKKSNAGTSIQEYDFSEELQKQIEETAIKNRATSLNNMFKKDFYLDPQHFYASERQFRPIGTFNGNFRTRMTRLKMHNTTEVDTRMSTLMANLAGQIESNKSTSIVNEEVANALINDNIRMDDMSDRMRENIKSRYVSIFRLEQDDQATINYDAMFDSNMYRTILSKLKSINEDRKSKGLPEIKELFIDPLMVNQIFGYREKKFDDKFKASPKAKKFINALTTSFSKFMGDEKQNIIIRNPSVVMDNFLSNFSTVLSLGVSMSKIGNDAPLIASAVDKYRKDYADFYNAMNEYLILKNKDVRTEDESNQLAELETQIVNLSNEIKNNRVYYPMKNGVDSNLIDETLREKNDVDSIYSNIIEYPLKVLNRKEMFGQLRDHIANEVAMNESSLYYKEMMRANRLGDIIPKIMIYENGLDNGKSREEAFDYANNLLVNYNVPLNSGILRALDKTGAFFFIKWFAKTQLVSLNMWRENPVSALTGLMLKQTLMINTIAVENLIAKPMKGLFSNSLGQESNYFRYGWLTN